MDKPIKLRHLSMKTGKIMYEQKNGVLTGE